MLKPTVKLQSADTLKRDIMKPFSTTRECVKKEVIRFCIRWCSLFADSEPFSKSEYRFRFRLPYIIRFSLHTPTLAQGIRPTEAERFLDP